MKATARILVGWLAVVMSLSAGKTLAGAFDVATTVGWAAAVLGQADGANASTADKRQQAEGLLGRAREAMAQNDLAAAESLVVQAEKLEVPYSAIHLGDTPKKVRRDLDRMRSAASSPARPSQAFLPLTGNKKKDPPKDPFAGRPSGVVNDPIAANASPDSQSVTPLPPVGVGTTLRMNGTGASATSPFGQTLPSAPPSNDDIRLPPALARGYAGPATTASGVATASGPATSGYDSRLSGQAPTGTRAQADDMIRNARRALAVGDVRRAADLAQQAKRLQVRFEPLDDTPDKVEAAIAKHQEVTSLDKNTESFRRGYARMLMEEAESLLRWGDFDQADQLADRAARQQVTYSPYEAKPEDLLGRIAAARRGGGANPLPAGDRALPLGGNKASSGVIPAGGYSTGPAGTGMASDQGAAQALYQPSSDPTRNVAASNQVAMPATRPAEYAEQIPAPSDRPLPAGGPVGGSQGYTLFQQGEAALKAHDRDRAYDLFRQATAHSNEMDQVTAQRLQDHLQLLSSPSAKRPGVPGGQQPVSPADEALARQQALVRQITMEMGHQEANARTLREKDPKAALANLEQARTKIESAGLESGARDALLRRIDRSITETKQYIDRNRPRLELTEKNDRTKQDLDREAKVKTQTQQKLAALVDEYNRLMDEQRYPEAEVVAKRAAELAPKEQVAQQILRQSSMIRHYRNAMSIKDDKERGVLETLTSVDKSSVPVDDSVPYHLPDAKDWKQLTEKRLKLLADHKRHRTEREVEIERKLKTPISVAFKTKPLLRAMEELAKLTDVNIHVDEEGLRQEGISPDTPVTLDLRGEIMLKSALQLMLEPLHLSYVVKNEVLKITSEAARSGQVYTTTYNVADLVMPIPNFVATPRMGLAGAYHDALGNVGFGGGAGGAFGTVSTPMAVVASKDGKQNSGAVNPSVLAQLGTQGGGNGMGGGQNMPMGFGPGGLGGGTQADFDSLIDLITSTVQPTTWDTVGGPGSIAPFETNLSIVVSQTQEVHEEIVDLLEQLRRMQDLQVTIEVKFITLNDDFFERMGVDFDFNIRKNTSDPAAGGFGPITTTSVGGSTVNTRQHIDPTAGTSVVGLQNIGSNPASSGIFTSDLDIPFRQGSYALAVPQFGPFDAAAGASLGFAILSDIEAYFFINAAQGDKRSNVLQAPKVTLFNGQQAFVSDTSQTPFVISVVPVVGDFAAAQQPVIVVLSEGTFMTVQAVVSNDRRFVRLTIVPFFSKIGKDVKTFTFQGSETTTTDTTREGLITNPNGDKFRNKKDNTTTTKSGTTVQLPTFSFVTVTTTVSVPDGGTVLLGGIKRLSEGRNEFGVPVLDKIPYLNRLFKNVAIGRETSSLMMMVTPRIIIQEEEEEKLGIQPSP